jgi:hypothetical protein
MKGRRLQPTGAFALAAMGYAQQPYESKLPADYPYCPAYVSMSETLHRELTVFPWRGRAFNIPIRSLAAVTFSPDARSLYGPCSPDREREKEGEAIKIAICQVDLYTGDTLPIQGTAHLLSRDRGKPRSLVVTMFALTPPDGKLTLVRLPADGRPWLNLSLSPDKERAVGMGMPDFPLKVAALV